MIVPTFLAMALVMVEIYVTKDFTGCKTKLFECLLYLPLFQWIQTYNFYKEILSAAQEKEKVEEFAQKINCWIDNFKEFQVDDEWSWGKIEPKFRNFEANTKTGKQCCIQCCAIEIIHLNILLSNKHTELLYYID